MVNQRSMTIVFYGIILYFITLLCLAPINLLSFDTYYYWEWSRHLDLSYYDGSPMIAYFIKLSTLLFGDTLFALNMVGIVSAALTCLTIYQTARLFLSKEASYIATSLWLFSPLVTLYIFKQTTYDTPLALFWSLTLYCVAKFISTNKLTWFYMIGISTGLMMLSKYSGVILILALFIFLLLTSYRYLFKTPYFYGTVLLALVIFSPVLIWNYQHEWVSFVYQINTHRIDKHANSFISIIEFYFGCFWPALNFMLLPPTLCWFKQATYISFDSRNKTDKKTSIVNLCRVTCTTFVFFYLLTASQAMVKSSWLLPYLIASALLGGFCFQTFNYRKSAFILIAAYGLISIAILVNNVPQLAMTTPPKLINYTLLQKFNIAYPRLPNIVLSPGWIEARMLFFLKNKPNVYTIDCNSLQNQYALWSTDVNQKMKHKQLKEALFIDPFNRLACVQPYFDRCVRLDMPSYVYKKRDYTIYAYKCTN